MKKDYFAFCSLLGQRLWKFFVWGFDLHECKTCLQEQEVDVRLRMMRWDSDWNPDSASGPVQLHALELQPNKTWKRVKLPAEENEGTNTERVTERNDLDLGGFWGIASITVCCFTGIISICCLWSVLFYISRLAVFAPDWYGRTASRGQKRGDVTQWAIRWSSERTF